MADDDAAVPSGPEGFTYRVRKDGTVHVQHHGRDAALLRGSSAARFLRAVEDVEDRDPQQVMARVTGSYRRGNERTARDHPRNRSR